jgi:hypothetical protein
MWTVISALRSDVMHPEASDHSDDDREDECKQWA